MLDLGGPRLKLRRAQHHLDLLTAEINSFLKSEPYKATAEFDRERKRFNVRGRIKSEPDPMWPVIAGEIAHHLRSALDQVVYQAAPRRIQRSGHCGWPIFVEMHDEWCRIRDNMASWLPSKVFALVEAAQPFKRTDIDPALDLLAILADLDNKDKHRVTPMVGCAHDIHVEMFLPGLDTGQADGTYHITNGGRITYDGAPIGWFTVDAPQGTTMYVRPVTVAQIQFGHGRAANLPVPELCREIHARVTNLVDQFEREFSSDLS